MMVLSQSVFTLKILFFLFSKAKKKKRKENKKEKGDLITKLFIQVKNIILETMDLGRIYKKKGFRFA